jgi:hypothetical protein
MAFRYGIGVDYGGMDVAEDGDGAYCFVAPPYTGDGNWDAIVYRFENHGPPEELKGAPPMYAINAFGISSFDDIWFAGLSFEAEAPGNLIIANFRGDEWVIYEDPSGNGFQKIHFFAPNNGWACEADRTYRFNGTTWYSAGEVPGVDRLHGCDFESPTDIWAAATKEGGGGVILHYAGGVWREVFEAGPNAYVADVAMWDGYNGWAVGSEKVGNTYHGRIWQCDHGEWVPRICPTERSMYHVEVVSNHEAWAAGGNTILHYQTEVLITPASFGRIKAAFAAGAGFGSGREPHGFAAARAPESPPATTPGRIRENPDSTSASEGRCE